MSILGNMFGGQGDNSKTVAVLKGAKTGLDAILSVLNTVDARLDSIVSKSEKAAKNIQSAAGAGQSANSMGLALGSTTATNGSANVYHTTVNGKPVQSITQGGDNTSSGNNLALGTFSGGNPGGGSGSGGGSRGGGLLGTLRSAAVPAVASAFLSNATTDTQAVYTTDPYYRTLRMLAGGNSAFQNSLPMTLAKGYQGGYLSTDDLNQATMTAMNAGFGLQTLNKGFMSSMAGLGKLTGAPLNDLMGISSTLSNAQNFGVLRSFGVNTMNPLTGQPNNLDSVLNGIMKASFFGRQPNMSQLKRGLGIGGGFRQTLLSAGLSPDQITELEPLFIASAQTGMPINTSNKTFMSAAKKLGATDTVENSAQNAAGKQAQVSAEQRQGVVRGIDTANATKEATATLEAFNTQLMDAVGALKGFTGGLTGGPGGSGATGNFFNSLLNDIFLSKLLKGGGAAGKAVGAAEDAAGVAGKAGGLLSKVPGVALASRVGGRTFGAIGKAGPWMLGSQAVSTGDSLILPHLKKGSAPHKAVRLGGDAASGILAGMGSAALIGSLAGSEVPIAGNIAGAIIGGGIGLGMGLWHMHEESKKKPNQSEQGDGPGGNAISQYTYPQIEQMAAGLGAGSYRITSTLRNGGSNPNSYHLKGQAVDFAGPTPSVDSPQLLRIDKFFAEKYGPHLAELIYSGPGGVMIKNGQTVGDSTYASVLSQHHNHVHVAVTPQGLRALNLTGGGDPSTRVSNSLVPTGLDGTASNVNKALSLIGADQSYMSLAGGGGYYAAPASSGSTAPATPPGKGSLTASQVYKLARQAGLSPSQAVIATAISGAESGWSPGATGDVSLENATWGPSEGLWQVRSLKSQTGTGQDRDASRLYDPNFNAHAMVDISGHGSNWRPWSTFTSGAYLAYLSEARQAASANANLPSASTGKWMIEKDQTYRVHQGEMILPAQISEAVRGALVSGAGGVGAGSAHGCKVEINLSLPNADQNSARKFATMVRDYLDHDTHTQAVGKR